MADVKVRIILDGKEADVSLQRLQSEMQKLGQAQGVVRQGTDRSGYALQNFGRILQDSQGFAYSFQQGMMGIGNNIPVFIDSMQLASREAGGFKGALSGMIATLSGPMGAIFLLGSVLPTALTVLPTLFKGSAEEVKTLNKEMDALVKVTKTVAGVEFENADQLQRAINRLGDDDTTNSLIGRKKAEIERLEDLLSKYTAVVDAVNKVKNPFTQTQQARDTEKDKRDLEAAKKEYEALQAASESLKSRLLAYNAQLQARSALIGSGGIDAEQAEKARKDAEEKRKQAEKDAEQEAEDEIDLMKETSKSIRDFERQDNKKRQDEQKEAQEKMMKQLNWQAKQEVKLTKEKIEELEEIRQKEADSWTVTIRTSQQLGEAIGEGIAGGITGRKNVVKEAMKQMLLLILDYYKQQVLIAQFGAGVRVANGDFTALVQLAAITAGFETLKGIVASWRKGGYTGQGGNNEEAGTVHRGEYVLSKQDVDRIGLRNIEEFRRNQYEPDMKNFRKIMGGSRQQTIKVSEPYVIKLDNRSIFDGQREYQLRFDRRGY